MKKYSIFGLIISLGLGGVIFASGDYGKVPHVFKPRDLLRSGEMNDNFSSAAGERNLLSKELAVLRKELETLRGELSSALLQPQSVSVDIVNSNTNSIVYISSSMAALVRDVDELKHNVGCFKRDGVDIILEGKNLVVRDAGLDSGSIVPGLGNIKVGREDNADRSWFGSIYSRNPSRTGSNNVIVGGSHEYTGSGALMVGALGRSSNNGVVVFGCENQASGRFSSAIGGTNRHASSTFETNFGVSGSGTEIRAKRVIVK